MSTPTSTTDAEALIDNLDQKSRFHHFHNLLHKYPWVSPLIVLLIAVIVFGLLNNKFWGISNLSLITQQVSIVGTIAIAQTLVILTALLVCLIPTTIGGLLSAIGIAGMDRMLQANVLAMSGRAVRTGCTTGVASVSGGV